MNYPKKLIFSFFTFLIFTGLLHADTPPEPVFSPSNLNATVLQGRTYRKEFKVTDPYGKDVEVKIHTQSPNMPGLSFSRGWWDSSSCTLTWDVPNHADVKDYTVELIATNSTGQKRIAKAVITVKSMLPPSFDPKDLSGNARAGVKYQRSFKVRDPAGGTADVSLKTLTSGMEKMELSGSWTDWTAYTLTWDIPVNAGARDYAGEIHAIGNTGVKGISRFNIKVLGDSAPAFFPVNLNDNVLPGKTYEKKFRAFDPGGNVNVAITRKPSEMSALKLEPVPQSDQYILSWAVPANTPARQYFAEITAVGRAGKQTAMNVWVTVISPKPPTFSGDLNASVEQGAKYEKTFTVSHLGSDQVTVAVTSKPSEMSGLELKSVGSGSGLTGPGSLYKLTWEVPLNLEAKDYSPEITATGSNGLMTVSKPVIKVYVPPRPKFMPHNLNGTVKRGHRYEKTFRALDPDGKDVEVEITSRASGMQDLELSSSWLERIHHPLNPVIYTLSWNVPSNTAARDYAAELTATSETNGQKTVLKTIVTVTDRRPIEFKPDNLNATVKPGNTYSKAFTVFDPDMGVTTAEIQTRASGMQDMELSRDVFQPANMAGVGMAYPVNYTLTWKIPANAAPKEYNFEIVGKSDAGSKTTLRGVITVPVVQTPQLKPIQFNPANLNATMKPGEEYSKTFTVQDPNGGAASAEIKTRAPGMEGITLSKDVFQAANAVPFGMYFGPVSYTLEWDIPANAAAKDYDVEIEGKSTLGIKAIQKVTIKIPGAPPPSPPLTPAPAKPPVFNPANLDMVLMNHNYTKEFCVTDPEKKGKVQVDLKLLSPEMSGMDFSNQTGSNACYYLYWVLPDDTKAGDYFFELTATSKGGNKTVLKVKVTLRPELVSSPKPVETPAPRQTPQAEPPADETPSPEPTDVPEEDGGEQGPGDIYEGDSGEAPPTDEPPETPFEDTLSSGTLTMEPIPDQTIYEGDTLRLQVKTHSTHSEVWVWITNSSGDFDYDTDTYTWTPDDTDIGDSGDYTVMFHATDKSGGPELRQEVNIKVLPRTRRGR